MYNKIGHDIKQKFFQDNFENDGQRFIAWYLRNIYSLQDNDVIDSITDGPGDKKIDAIYIDNDNEEIHIIQGKYYSKKSVDNEPILEIMSIYHNLKDIKNLQLCASKKLSDKLKDLQDALDSDYHINFELVVTSMLTNGAEEMRVNFCRTLNSDDTINADFEVVDNEALQSKYDHALNNVSSPVNQKIQLHDGKYMKFTMNNTNVIIAAIRISDCLSIDGIKDGRLFQSNVRNALSKKIKVNQNIALSLQGNIEDFFFFHNGITAICSKMSISDDHVLAIEGLDVVNGCQSLTTIYRNSSFTKEPTEGYIMFRFYEISDREKIDQISRNTNFQTTVKSRDLVSNRQIIKSMKRSFEYAFPNSRLLTKRGETPPKLINKELCIDIELLGKLIAAWHLHRPSVAANPTKLFEGYFDRVFVKDYSPENINALNELFSTINLAWNDGVGGELEMTVFSSIIGTAKLIHLTTIALMVSKYNEKPYDMIPEPAGVLTILKKNNYLDEIIKYSAMRLNRALTIIAEQSESNLIPKNWVKNNLSIDHLKKSIDDFVSFEGAERKKEISQNISLDDKLFSALRTE